jgi:hypothetical protein
MKSLFLNFLSKFDVVVVVVVVVGTPTTNTTAVKRLNACCSSCGMRHCCHYGFFGIVEHGMLIVLYDL